MSDDDKKKGYGLVQPPKAVEYVDDDPTRGMTGGQRATYLREQDANSKPMPTVRIPDRSSPQSRYVDSEEMSSFGPPKPTPDEMQHDRFEAWWAKQTAAEGAKGAKDDNARKEAEQRAWYERGGQDLKVPARGHQAEPPTQYEWDENGQPTRAPEAPEWLKDFHGRMEYEAEKRLPKMVTPEQERKIGDTIGTAKAAANKFATDQYIKQLEYARSRPGGDWAARKGLDAVDVARKVVGGAHEKLMPKTREPYQMQREFSSEEEKAAYLKRIKDAASKVEPTTGDMKNLRR